MKPTLVCFVVLALFGSVARAQNPTTELELHLSAWSRFETDVMSGSETRPQFLVPLIRPSVEGFFLNRKVHGLVQPEFAGRTATLLDAFIEFTLDPALQIRLGQFRTPYSRAFIGPTTLLQFPDFGPVVDTFRLGRDTGVMLFGRPFGGALEYYAGLFNGAAINDPADDQAAFMPVARLVYNIGHPVPYDQSPQAAGEVAPGLAVGVAAAYRRRSITDAMTMTVSPEESWHAGADLALVAGRVNAVAEGFVQRLALAEMPAATRFGAYAQSGVYLAPALLELAGRVGWIEETSQTYELDLNLYAGLGPALGHHLKGSLRYAFDHLLTEPVDQRHRVTMQVQWWM